MAEKGLIVAIVSAAIFGTAILWLGIIYLRKWIKHKCWLVDQFFSTHIPVSDSHHGYGHQFFHFLHSKSHSEDYGCEKSERSPSGKHRSKSGSLSPRKTVERGQRDKNTYSSQERREDRRGRGVDRCDESERSPMKKTRQRQPARDEESEEYSPQISPPQPVYNPRGHAPPYMAGAGQNLIRPAPLKVQNFGQQNFPQPVAHPPLQQMPMQTQQIQPVQLFQYPIPTQPFQPAQIINQLVSPAATPVMVGTFTPAYLTAYEQPVPEPYTQGRVEEQAEDSEETEVSRRRPRHRTADFIQIVDDLPVFMRNNEREQQDCKLPKLTTKDKPVGDNEIEEISHGPVFPPGLRSQPTATATDVYPTPSKFQPVLQPMPTWPQQTPSIASPNRTRTRPDLYSPRASTLKKPKTVAASVPYKEGEGMNSRFDGYDPHLFQRLNNQRHRPSRADRSGRRALDAVDVVGMAKRPPMMVPSKGEVTMPAERRATELSYSTLCFNRFTEIGGEEESLSDRRSNETEGMVRATASSVRPDGMLEAKANSDDLSVVEMIEGPSAIALSVEALVPVIEEPQTRTGSQRSWLITHAPTPTPTPSSTSIMISSVHDDSEFFDGLARSGMAGRPEFAGEEAIEVSELEEEGGEGHGGV
ncbi:hypothetical protein B0J11DRAFT_580006 [Dendryphion nanum]|uniref:Uncharacterized protein n=1 Tax=Dendryphion nanum TaxID=256645 RepID=A0A9P9IM54_9PLEO|nr:hypothetical protein B0J11DRAFT_580006 [Dendryphion nanum]